MIHTITATTPVGQIILGDYQGSLSLCDWATAHREWVLRRVARYFDSDYDECRTPLLNEAERQLTEYFQGKRHRFDIPVKLAGTEFQKQVWEALSHIGYGDTMSYQQLAQEIGRPNACRAVASAARANPISIIVPCHRLIGSDGSLTGYAGGIGSKRFLLELEQCR